MRQCPAFREMISAAQHNPCANVANRQEFGKGSVYSIASQVQTLQSTKVHSQGLALLKTRGYAGCLIQDAVKSIK